MANWKTDFDWQGAREIPISRPKPNAAGKRTPTTEGETPPPAPPAARKLRDILGTDATKGMPTDLYAIAQTGISVESAAGLLGVKTNCLRDWITRGEDIEDPQTESERLICAIAAAWRMGRAVNEQTLLHKVGTELDVSKYQWQLARVHAHQWSEKASLKIEQTTVGVQVSVLGVANMTNEQIKKHITAAKKVLNGEAKSLGTVPTAARLTDKEKDR